VYEAIPRFFESHDYQNPEDPMDCPWQEAYQTKEHCFEWLQNHPTDLARFMKWVDLSRRGLPSWLDTFPFAQIVEKESNQDTVLFVDVGSGHGHQSVELRKRFPELVGRVIVQDTPHVIGAVQPSHGIEPQAYDFFTPQPVKGMCHRAVKHKNGGSHK
jgi:hypothetical protein